MTLTNNSGKNEKVTMLMYSSARNDLQLVYTLLNHKPNVNAKDAYNRNALFYAINAEKGDNADVVLALISSGISIDDVDTLEGHTPLTLSSSKGLKQTVKTLLEHGANPDHQVIQNGFTALHYAVTMNNVDIIKLLIIKGANLKLMNKQDKTPISLALQLSHTDIYTMLVNEYNEREKREKEAASELLIAANEDMNNSLKKSDGKKKKFSDLISTNRKKIDNFQENYKQSLEAEVKKLETEKTLTLKDNSSLNTSASNTNTARGDRDKERDSREGRDPLTLSKTQLSSKF